MIGKRWRAPLLIGVPLLAAALAGAFLLYRSAETPALTQNDTVMLSSVVNGTGDAIFDDTLSEALALQLRQSPFLNLVPEPQVQATLRLMGRDPMTPITADIGREVCQRAGAKALLGGTIAMMGSSYVVTLNAQDCVHGKVIAEQQAQASTKESVLSAMGTAVSAFRAQLGESPASVQRYDTKIEDATTPSLEALKAYSQGLRTRRITGDFDSVPFFRRAIDLDPTFALAYARLGTVYSNLNQLDEGKKMTTRAYELRDKVSEIERLYIEARYYTTVQNDTQKALDTYNVWLGTYPNDYTALINSALLNKNRGERAEAIRKLELAMKVAPDQPLALINLGQTYFEGGQYADAKRVYENAIKLQDSTGARVGLYQSAVMLGDLALADRQADAVRGRRDEIDMLTIRMFAATYRGRMNEAAGLATDIQARALALSRAQTIGNPLMELAISEALVGLDDEAQARIAKADADGLLGPDTTPDRMMVAALLQDASSARKLLPIALETQKNRSELASAAAESHIEALARLAEGKPVEAAALMEPVSFRDGVTEIISIWSIAKLRAEDWASAAKGFDFLASLEGRRGFSAATAFAWAMRGRAYAKLDQKEEARKSYQKFFEIFKDADPDLPLLLQTREEFAKLGS